jgi:DNA-binding GntR family transcriptional regulator
MPPRNPQRTYRWVSARLRERIEAGEWLPGEQIPTLRQIVDEYAVSMGTARKAVDVLKEAGLIEVYPGYGAFIPSSG